MATIVTPYNPWRENLAVNVLGGLLNNFLEQNRQAEQNRKVNAFRGQLQQDLQNNIIQEQGNSALSLAQPQAPAGYNASPWASMFHKTDSPLTPFDIGTSVIPMRDPTVQEISNTADTLGASQRFSMINPETIQGIKAGMIQQAEAQRIRGLQEDYARQHYCPLNPDYYQWYHPWSARVSEVDARRLAARIDSLQDDIFRHLGHHERSHLRFRIHPSYETLFNYIYEV